MAGKFVAYTGKDGKHYFRLKAGNGEVIFTSRDTRPASPA